MLLASAAGYSPLPVLTAQSKAQHAVNPRADLRHALYNIFV